MLHGSYPVIYGQFWFFNHPAFQFKFMVKTDWSCLFVFKLNPGHCNAKGYFELGYATCICTVYAIYTQCAMCSTHTMY